MAERAEPLPPAPSPKKGGGVDPAPPPFLGEGAGGRGSSLIAVALFTIIAVWLALTPGTFPDFFIYRAGSEIGLRGESPYDIPRIRQLASAEYPDENPNENSFVNNCGYFLPPMAILAFAPFAVLPWKVAKVAWAITLGLAALGITRLPDLLRKPGEPVPAQSVVRMVVLFPLLLNPVVLAIAAVGQVTIVSVGCVAAGLWCFSRNRPTLGVMLWAVAFVKPHVALPLIPLAWYLGGWKRAAALVALVAALNLLGATIAGGSPLFLRDYLDYLPTGHKAVRFNQANLNPAITSWNRLLASCGGPLVELNAVTTLAGYLVWGGLVLARCALTGAKPSAAWACAAAVAGAVVCSQVLAYELLMLAVAVPWVRDLLASKQRMWGWAAVALLVVQTIPFDSTTVMFDYYRPVGAMAFALLVLLGPMSEGEPFAKHQGAYAPRSP